jgi:hypothetical protein
MYGITPERDQAHPLRLPPEKVLKKRGTVPRVDSNSVLSVRGSMPGERHVGQQAEDDQRSRA